jgi:hypothetical protein
MYVAVQVIVSTILCLARVFIVPGLVDARSDEILAPARSLLQDTPNIVASLRVANLTTIIDVAGDALVPEQELTGRINVTPSDMPVLYGAYNLGPDEVAQINHTIASELVCCLRFSLCACELLCTWYCASNSNALRVTDYYCITFIMKSFMMK